MTNSSVTPPKGRPTPSRPANAISAPGMMPPMSQDAPTTPTQWKSVRRHGFVVTLPSGNVARIKRTFSMINMLEHGSIANPLGAVIREAVDSARNGNGSGELDIQKLDQSTDDGQLALAQFLDMMMKSMSDIFVEPRVLQVPEGEDTHSWEPSEDGCISVADLDAADQMAAFTFAQGGAGSMSSFRQESSQAVVTTQDGAELQL